MKNQIIDGMMKIFFDLDTLGDVVSVENILLIPAKASIFVITRSASFKI